MIELERKKQLGMLEGSEQDESQKQDQKLRISTKIGTLI